MRPAEGDKEALTEEEGEAEPEGLKLGDTLLDADGEGEADAEGEPLGLSDALALELGESEGL